MRFVGKLWNDRRGATAIEYALIASLISVAAIVSFETLGGEVENKYGDRPEARRGDLSGVAAVPTPRKNLVSREGTKARSEAGPGSSPG